MNTETPALTADDLKNMRQRLLLGHEYTREQWLDALEIIVGEWCPQAPVVELLDALDEVQVATATGNTGLIHEKLTAAMRKRTRCRDRLLLQNEPRL